MRFVDVHRLSCCRPGQVVKLTIGSLCINYPKRSPQIRGYYRSLTGFHSVRGKHLRTKAILDLRDYFCWSSEVS
jgi:hypothetical protein